ncbi:Rossmann-like domain-containing protein [Chloroflexota bacterium]
MHGKTILEEELELLPKLTLKVEDLNMGKRYAAVRLSSAKCGVAHRPREAASYSEYLSIKGKDAVSIAELALSKDLTERTIGIATINALTEISKQVRYGDPLDSLDIKDKVIATVGYFPPVVRRFSSLAKEIRVIERREMPNAYPPEKAEEVLESASVVIITGSALTYGGMESYLEYSKNARHVIVLGPTSSMNPQPFFKRGTSVVGGIEILDNEKLFASEKQCKDMFGIFTRKIYFDRRDISNTLIVERIRE